LQFFGICGYVNEIKIQEATQDDLVKRSIAEWEDLKEYRLNMDVVFEIERQTD
jgi:hypothetical protein